jgi:hypothetical protein
MSNHARQRWSLPLVLLCTFALATGCASGPSNPPPSADPPYPSGYGSAVKKQMLDYVKAHFPATATIRHDPPDSIEHPGIWPFENKRVYYVYHDRLPAYPKAGFYAAMISDVVDVNPPAPNWTVTTPPPPSTMPDSPLPDLVIYRGWIYVNGDSPRVGTRAVIAQAQGCAVLIYLSPTNTGVRQRVCMLEGDPDSYTWVFDRQAGGKQYLVPGTFLELETDANGYFLKWVQDTAGNVVRTVDQLQGDSRHDEVMGAVARGQYLYEVS